MERRAALEAGHHDPAGSWSRRATGVVAPRTRRGRRVAARRLVGLALVASMVVLAPGSDGSVPRAEAGPPACPDTDGDWLCDAAELPYGDIDGDGSANWADPDDDGDGLPTIGELADPNGDGDPRDAADSDRDRQPDWLDAPVRRTFVRVVAEQKISDLAGGLGAALDNGDEFSSVASIGDLDRDGVTDLAVGALGDDAGGGDRGAVHVLFLNTDGTVKGEQEVSSTSGGFGAGISDGDQFGWAVSGLGDLDGDGVGDLAVGAVGDNDGGSDRGAVWIVFLNTNGTVKSKQLISDTSGGLAAVLTDNDSFGSDVSSVGDLDGDGLPELVVGAYDDDDGGSGRGAVYVLFLNADGTVRDEQKISDTTGGLVAPLSDGGGFGYAVGGLGDLDGDGLGDLAVGAWRADIGGGSRGAVYVLRLNANGTVKGEQVVASSTGGFGLLDNDDRFGSSVAGLGDLDGDGVPDMLAGASKDHDGANNAGAVYVVNLSPTGAVVRQSKISQLEGGFAGPLSGEDRFGDRAAGIGDLDGDGAVDIAVGAWGDDDGGSDRGAVYVLSLQPRRVTVNSTSDGADAAVGDGVCDTGGTNAAGTDECTLRSALQEVNAAAIDMIEFDLPVGDPGHAAGAWTIAPSTPLPTLGAPVTVDATTQPGTSVNTAAFPAPMNATLTVRLSGVSAPPGSAGLRLGAGSSGSEIRGLSFTGFVGPGASAIAVSGSSDHVIAGNHFGADPSGTSAVPNQLGVQLAGAGNGNHVGGTVPADRNLFAAHVEAHLDVATAGTVIQGNEFGWLFGGTEVASPTPAGVVARSGSTGSVIGGAAPGAGNRIRGVAVAVQVIGSSTASTAVIGNRFADVTGLSIDLAGDGPTANDPGDADSGPNSLLNHPLVDDVVASGGDLEVTFRLDVPAGTHRVEWYADAPADRLPSAAGMGQVPLGASTVVHPGGGVRTFVATVDDPGAGWVSGAVTVDLGGGGFGPTSEFGPAVCVGDSDGDGLCDGWELQHGDTDGDSSPNANDPDDDGDGIATAAEWADPNGDGDPRDARDTDRDGRPDWLDRPTLRTGAEVADEQRISAAAGGLAAVLDDGDGFGSAATAIGDLDGDGIEDLVVGAPGDDDGGVDRGAVHVLFVRGDGTVRAEQKISDTSGGLASGLDDGDRFGRAVAAVGDLDGDGIGELAVGVPLDDDGGPARGSVRLLFLRSDGTVRDERTISDLSGGLGFALQDGDGFGTAVSGIGDVDGDGLADLAVGAPGADDGGADRGRIHVLFLRADATVRGERTIGALTGGLAPTPADGDEFGAAVAGLGDVDADGTPDLAVGAPRRDEGGTDRGALHVLFLQPDGSVAAQQTISGSSGGLVAVPGDGDLFGAAVAGVGDGDRDGTPDLVVGAPHGGPADEGAVYVIHPNPDGTVDDHREISDTEGGLSSGLDPADAFGASVAGLGDLDGDGTIGVAVGASGDDDGGGDRGAVHVVDLVRPDTVAVNSTGDAADQAPGDGDCRTGALNSGGEPECTLRAALEEANSSPIVGAVHFEIPTSDPGHVAGTWTIMPAAGRPLPSLVAPVVIDATTQPGTVVNTALAPAPLDGHLAIELSGAADDATADWDGLVLGPGAGGSEVRGISFVEWDNATSDAILVWGSSGSVIAGNYFGVRADGVTAGVGSTAGVGLASGASANRVGGTSAADRNLFAGSTVAGGAGWGHVWVEGATSVGNVVQGNEFGVVAGGAAAPADTTGVVVISGDALVGGTAPGAGNRIASGEHAVVVDDVGGAGRATVLGNRISGQTGVPIDLGDDGRTANDPLDADTGPNDLLNHPLLLRADGDGGETAVAFELDVPAGDHRVEFFTSAVAHPSGSGPGDVLVHVATVTHPGGGPRTFEVAFPAAPGAVVTATVTRSPGGGASGATSEFSNAVTVTAAGADVTDHGARRVDLDALGGADGGAPSVGNTAGAIELEGGAERLTAPTFDITDTELTVSGWVRLDTVAGEPRLVSRRGAGGSILDLFVSGTAATARLHVGGVEIEVSGGSVGPAAWHQLAATWDGATLVLHVDGEPVDSAAAVGLLATDPVAPLVIGNVERVDHGLDGRIDDLRISHVARSTDWIRTEYLNLTRPDDFVTLGASQAAPPGTWTTTTTASRTGVYALEAPPTADGADAWATVRGVDEPGLAFESWWYLTDPGAARVAAGTLTGDVAVDQHEIGIVFGAVDLATVEGTARTVDATTATSVLPGAWTRVEIRTDELGRSAVYVDGTQVLAPTLHHGGPGRGSAGLRVGHLPIGRAVVDDVRLRRYVSDEPTATLGPLHRS